MNDDQKNKLELMQKWFEDNPTTLSLSDEAVARMCRKEGKEYGVGYEYEVVLASDVRLYRQQLAAMDRETKKLQAWNSLAQGRKA